MSHAENRADILHQQIAEDRARFARSSSDVRYVIIIIFIVLFIIWCRNHNQIEIAASHPSILTKFTNNQHVAPVPLPNQNYEQTNNEQRLNVRVSNFLI